MKTMLRSFRLLLSIAFLILAIVVMTPTGTAEADLDAATLKAEAEALSSITFICEEGDTRPPCTLYNFKFSQRPGFQFDGDDGSVLIISPEGRIQYNGERLVDPRVKDNLDALTGVLKAPCEQMKENER